VCVFSVFYVKECGGFPTQERLFYCCRRAAAGYTWCEFANQPPELEAWLPAHGGRLRPLQCRAVEVANLTVPAEPSNDGSDSGGGGSGGGASAPRGGASQRGGPVYTGVPFTDDPPDKDSGPVATLSAGDAAACAPLRRAGDTGAAVLAAIVLLVCAGIALVAWRRQRVAVATGGRGYRASAESSPASSGLGMRLVRAAKGQPAAQHGGGDVILRGQIAALAKQRCACLSGVLSQFQDVQAALCVRCTCVVRTSDQACPCAVPTCPHVFRRAKLFA
jgi:hypothetical protein